MNEEISVLDFCSAISHAITEFVMLCHRRNICSVKLLSVVVTRYIHVLSNVGSHVAIIYTEHRLPAAVNLQCDDALIIC